VGAPANFKGRHPANRIYINRNFAVARALEASYRRDLSASIRNWENSASRRSDLRRWLGPPMFSTADLFWLTAPRLKSTSGICTSTGP